MLEPVRMVKVSVVGPKEYLEVTSNALYRLSSLHIEDYSEEDEYFRIGEPLEKASRLSKFLVTVRSLLSHAGIKDGYEPERTFSVSELDRELDKKVGELEELITSRINRIRAIEEGLRRIADERRVIYPLKALGVPSELLTGYRNLSVFVGFVKANPFEKLIGVTKELEVFTAEYDGETVVAVFVRNDHADDVLKVLQEFAFREIQVPEISVSYDERLKQLEEEERSLRNELEKLNDELKRYEGENLDLLLALEEYLSIELEKSELPLKAATSKYAFVLVGYVPEERFDEFEKHLKEVSAGKVVALKISDSRWDPPTAMKNPGFAKPFELLTTSYAVPKYGEVDPTLIMAVLFPIFFGFMLGDIGYGLVILGLGLWLSTKFKTEGWQALLKVLNYSAISTIVFGFVYGEFFGFELFGEESLFAKLLGHESEIARYFAEMHPVANRLHDAPKLLVLTIAIGVLHMALAYVIGIRNVAKEHGWKHAVEEKFNWLMALISIALIITGFIVNNIAGVPVFQMNAAYLLAMPFIAGWAILTIIGEGPMFLIEYLTLLSNTISYARLLAVGLASVGFAIAFNYMAFEMLWPSGPVGIVVAIVVFLIGHVINILLGILDPGLQSLRLHYVEFFVKFFEGGGKLYSPFGRRRKYTKED
ncbi:V-type ATP synthase subunit I [Geoglobus acetivorans]|uniref:A-type ATP synthase subunit I n=1 Tax=Geoglobus acetivorans TaxID=565033 RepID=A0A0A7GIM9_GEOAI|nr:V-type ATP synthase subunit I [Geoglobus acetivorans]